MSSHPQSPTAHCPAAAREVGKPEQSLEVTTLGDFEPESVDMHGLVIIGSSATRVTRDGRVWTPHFVSG